MWSSVVLSLFWVPETPQNTPPESQYRDQWLYTESDRTTGMGREDHNPPSGGPHPPIERTTYPRPGDHGVVLS